MRLSVGPHPLNGADHICVPPQGNAIVNYRNSDPLPQIKLHVAHLLRGGVAELYLPLFLPLLIPFVECYHLYFHHTDVYALCFNANYLCRLQYCLCYHFFTLLQMDEGAYESIALSSVLGQMKTIPFLGSEFNFYVPVIVFLVSMFTLWKMTWGSRPHKKQVGVGGWREG